MGRFCHGRELHAPFDRQWLHEILENLCGHWGQKAWVVFDHDDTVLCIPTLRNHDTIVARLKDSSHLKVRPHDLVALRMHCGWVLSV